MSPVLALIVFVACAWLVWIFIAWLPPRLRDPVHIGLAAGGIYAVSFFVVTAFAVYMYGYLAGARSGVLPPGFATPVLVLAVAMVIGLPGYAAYRFFGLCNKNLRHKPPTVRRVHRRAPPARTPPRRRP
jgi:hypothetical protein